MPMGYWGKTSEELAIVHPINSFNTESGYIRVSRNNVVDYLHRVLWEDLVGPIPAGHTIDHKNGIRTDCRLTNLRCVTRAVNQRNTSKRSDNTSGVTGVSYWAAHKAWRAVVIDMVTGKQKIKTFGISKWGDLAFDMACDARAEMLNKLRDQGAEYTERHGK